MKKLLRELDIVDLIKTVAYNQSRVELSSTNKEAL